MSIEDAIRDAAARFVSDPSDPSRRAYDRARAAFPDGGEEARAAFYRFLAEEHAKRDAVVTPAADKLRVLLATRPAMPNTEELVRWWRTSLEMLPDLLILSDEAVAVARQLRAEIDAANQENARLMALLGGAMKDIERLRADAEGLDCDLNAARAAARANVEGFESALATEAYEKSILEQVERDLRAEVEALRPDAAAHRDRIEALAAMPPWFEGAMLAAAVGDAKSAVERSPVNLEAYRARAHELAPSEVVNILEELQLYRNLAGQLMALANYNAQRERMEAGHA